MAESVGSDESRPYNILFLTTGTPVLTVWDGLLDSFQRQVDRNGRHTFAILISQVVVHPHGQWRSDRIRTGGNDGYSSCVCHS